MMQEIVQKYWPAGADILSGGTSHIIALREHPQNLRIGINADGRDPIPMLEIWLSQHVGA